MRRACAILLALALVVRLAPAAHAAQPDAPVPVAVEDLTSRRFDGDGRLVVFTGEAIGEALRAPGGMVWVNVLGGSAVGVVVDRSMADVIGTWGDYHSTGDTVHVTGTFNVACDEHGGDMDVHATGFAVAALAVRRSRRMREEQEGS